MSETEMGADEMNMRDEVFDEFTAGLETVERPTDAIERLEAWLRGDEERYCEVAVSEGCAEVLLSDNDKDSPRVWGYERDTKDGPFGPADTLAKEPGLAATIHAAIDKAEELGL